MNRCRDFYIDMVEKPDNKMLDVLRKEEDALKSKTMKVNDITKLVNKELQNKDNVFESLKEHRVPIKDKAGNKGVNKADNKTGNKTEKGGKADNKEKPIEFTNKYTRLGKISDFNIIQKQPKKSIAQTNALLFSSRPIHKLTDFFDDLDIDDVENPFVIDGLTNGLATPNGLTNGLTNGSTEPTPLHTRPTKSQREQDETDLIGPPPTEKISSYKMFKMMKSQELC